MIKYYHIFLILSIFLFLIQGTVIATQDGFLNYMMCLKDCMISMTNDGNRPIINIYCDIQCQWWLYNKGWI